MTNTKKLNELFSDRELSESELEEVAGGARRKFPIVYPPIIDAAYRLGRYVAKIIKSKKKK